MFRQIPFLGGVRCCLGRLDLSENCHLFFIAPPLKKRFSPTQLHSLCFFPTFAALLQQRKAAQKLQGMATTRQLKVGRQLQKDIGEIIQRQGMAMYGGALITVMGVEVSPDLGFAKVVLSIFPSDKTDVAKAALNEKHIRTELAKRVKNQLRVVPELAFSIDTSLDYVEHIEQLLKDSKTS